MGTLAKTTFYSVMSISDKKDFAKVLLSEVAIVAILFPDNLKVSYKATYLNFKSKKIIYIGDNIKIMYR